MTIKIHRGTDQIGGCVTEYEYNGWHLFVDYGEQLPGYPQTDPLEVDCLTKGDLSKSALLITHYHGDHIGNISELPNELPIFMGKVGLAIQKKFAKRLSFTDKTKGKMTRMLGQLKNINTFLAGKAFTFGPFRITPVTLDHSAFDAYAFKIEAGETSVFHTGDFRTHGFRSRKLSKLIETYIGHVDYVVCEATNVSRPETGMTERELQKQFESSFKEHKCNIVYLSSTNIDRLFSVYHAALRAGRPFFIDKYQKSIMDVIVKEDPIWGKSVLYQYDKNHEPEPLQTTSSKEFFVNEKFSALLNQKGYVLIARANMKFNNLISKIPGEKVRYLSMWEGYVDPGNEAYQENLALALGSGYIKMHTSGHCDMNGLRELLTLLNPKAVIPIHTDSPDRFEQLFSAEWNVIRLHDGDAISTMHP